MTAVAAAGFVLYSVDTGKAHQMCQFWCSLPEYGRTVATANMSFAVGVLAGVLCLAFWFVTIRDWSQ